MPLLLFLLSLLLGAALPSDEYQARLHSGVCGTFWLRFNGRCYKYVSTSMSWADAEIFCVRHRANLASIHSLEEQNFIKTLVKNFDLTEGFTWIGLSDLSKEGHWMWSDGSAVDFVFWHEGQPDNTEGREHCVHMNWGPELKWNDMPCVNTYPFVCASREICH